MSGVMDRIREAAAKASSGALAGDRERPSFPRVAAQSPFPPDATRETFLARFREELETLAGRVYGPFDAEGVARQVIELVRGASEVLSWDEAEIGCPGLGDALRQVGIEMVQGEVPNDEDHQKALERLAVLGVGLSGVVAALADTGSLVVASGAGRSRVASLLPPVHVAVLRLSRLYPTLQDWLADGGPELARRTSNLVIVTGPSRTSDIEMQLTLGMHGPKELHVVLYGD